MVFILHDKLIAGKHLQRKVLMTHEIDKEPAKKEPPSAGKRLLRPCVIRSIGAHCLLSLEEADAFPNQCKTINLERGGPL